MNQTQRESTTTKEKFQKDWVSPTIANFTGKISSCKADGRSTSQGTFCMLRNTYLNEPAHGCPQQDCTLSHINPSHTLPFYTSLPHVNTIGYGIKY